MAELRVFVSSTCYDLSLLRSQLRLFIKNMGYEPIMSDYADILYDPRIHTHTSCVDEVRNCDILVLIIGSRFGGKATTEALNKIDFDVLKEENIDVDNLKEKGNLSVTQLEFLKAIENSIPVYTFIDKRVWHDHALYEKNKSNEIIDQIIFPSIEKQETAKFIFNFINFVRLRTKGNNIFPFEKAQDIEEILKKQWSGYFQRLLQEQRYSDSERKRIDVLSEQFEDLKTAILSSITNVDQRATAKGIVRYRQLAEFLFSLNLSVTQIVQTTTSFQKLLTNANIKEVIDRRTLEEKNETPHSFRYARAILLKEDNTFYESRFSREVIYHFEADWETFKVQDDNVKTIILETISEIYRPNTYVRYQNQDINNVYTKTSIMEFDLGDN